MGQANTKVAPSVLCVTLQVVSLARLPVVNLFERKFRRRFLCISITQQARSEIHGLRQFGKTFSYSCVSLTGNMGQD